VNYSGALANTGELSKEPPRGPLTCPLRWRSRANTLTRRCYHTLLAIDPEVVHAMP
jgi:hypothetical protein